MANRRRKPWDDNWERVKELPGGGQSKTFVVKRRDIDSKDNYVLKILRRQDELERRRRMAREVTALQQLDHPRLPKIIESNTDAVDDIDIPLFFVMDHIDGQTLEERIAQGQLKLDQAI